MTQLTPLHCCIAVVLQGLILTAPVTARDKMSEPVITVASIDVAQVYLLDSTSGEFTQALDPHRNPVFDGLLPYSALLSNKSDKRIIAYSVRWLCTDGDGTVTSPEASIFDFSRFPSSSDVPAHSSTFVTNLGGFAAGETSSAVHELASDLMNFFRSQQTIEIQLAAVLFADGTTAGSDPQSWIPRWKAQIEAQRDVFRDATSSSAPLALTMQAYIAAGSEAGRTVFPSAQATQLNAGQLREAARHSSSYQDLYTIYKGVFGYDVLSRIAAVGEKATRSEITNHLAVTKYPSVQL